MFRTKTHTLILILFVSIRGTLANDFADLKTISVLPLTEQQVAQAFDRSLSDACEQLPKDEPLELRSFTPYLTERDKRSLKTKPLPASRQSLFSVGLEFGADDRATLPKVSGGIIADYLANNCVLIQARIRKDLLDRKLYFHHRPLALTAQFRGSRISHPFQPLVATSIRDFHGIGLFVEETRILKAEKLRTLVLVFKNNVLTSRTGSRTVEQYEFAFIRGREAKIPERLDHHVFVTTDDRRTLHYLSPYMQPLRPSQCSILGRIAVIDYDSTGLYPKESATRSFRLETRSKYSLEQIDEYCSQNELKGGLHSNLTHVLDAIIDRKISPKGIE